ncbi:gliding motility-associated C-terminal domain-containing protein [Chitinophaga sp.]|uniref:Ig-like domain-containing protein n=1 Tax=Chitinophaga sp. TaxID=1869181 RepID=UPI0031E27B9C
MSKLLSLCLWLIIALFPLQAAFSFNRIYVNVNNPTPGTGTSWATAYNDLSAALAAGNQADTFWVAQGTYLPTTTGDRTIAFSPKPSQVIYGGFNGTEVLLSQRNWKTNITILSGDIGATGIASDNSYSVLRIINALVDGVTIRDGQADYNFPDLTANMYNTGGGVNLYADAAQPTVAGTIANCTFTNNYAIYGAGMGGIGIATGTSTPYITTKVSKCIFLNNTAYTAGGALSFNFKGACWGNNYTDNCIFIDNNATSGHGSVVANILDGTTSAHRPWMDNSVFWNNGEDLAYNSLANGATGGPYIEFAIVWRTGAEYGASNFSDATITWHDNDIYTASAGLPSSNINSDPQFTDASNYDFHVAPCSPVIDATIIPMIGSSTTDYDGNPRVNKTLDIGIYESTKTISAAPTASLQYFCENMNATPLVATGDNLLWYTAATGGTGSSTAPTPVTTTAGYAYYYVTQTTAGACESSRTKVTAYTSTQPTAPTVTDVTYCQDAVAVPLGTTGTAYLWYTTATGGTGTTTAPTPFTTTPSVTTYYKVTVSSGCESTRSPLNVTVTSTSAAPVVSDVTYCTNATASPLTATGTNLTWYLYATGGVGSAIAPTPVTTVNGTTYYYVTQTETGSCESVRTPIKVTVTGNAPAPVVTDVAYCRYETAAALTATGTNLKWYTAATGGTALSAAPVPATTVIGVTYYYVSQTVGCESDRAPLQVTVKGIPAAPAVSDVTYCIGSTAAQLTATGTNLKWYTTAAGGTGSATAPTPSTAVNGTTTYYVTQNPGCESNRAALTVTIGSQATPPIVNDFTYCQNAPAPALSASGTNLLWYTSASGGIGISIAPTPNTNSLGTTHYWVTQQDAGGCESERSELSVTISAQVQPPLVSDLDYCLNQAVPQLTATGTNLKWYTSSTGGTGSSTAPIPVTLSVGATTYYVSQTAGCESDRAALKVTVRASSSPVVTPLTICQYATATPVTAEGVNLLWYTSSSGGTGSATAPTPSILIPGTITYYVSQTDGCESARAPMTVTVKQSPVADFTTSGGCAGTPMTVTLVPAQSKTAFYTWNFYNAVSVSGDDPGPYEVLWHDPGEYTVSMIAYDGQCEVKVEKVVSVGVAPEIRVTPVTGTYCINDTVTLSATGAATYEWSPATNLSASSGAGVLATFKGDVTYTVTGKDAIGCMGTAAVHLSLSPDCKIYYILPTAFSPNGDGLNDVFRVKTSDLPMVFVMKVFNRIGQLVFESHDVNAGWDGMQKSQQAPLGAYVYMISAVTSEGKHIEQSGSVVITR